MPEALDANAQPLLTMSDQKDLQKRHQKDLQKRHQEDQKEIKRLQKELQRKEKAMAEMAALLVLRKKWEAFCSEDAES